jgi:hypothetical protein
MAYHGVLTPLSGLKANADLSSSQFRFVKFTSGKVAVCSTQGEQAFGVLQDKPAAANRAAAVAAVSGTIVKVEAGAAVSQGADVMTDSSGRAITWLTKNVKMGQALTAASAAGEVIEIVLLSTGTDVSTAKGTIQLDLTSAREIATNDTQNLAAHGGIMASDSTPALARVNGATDKALRLTWAATDVTELQFPAIAKPQDLDAGSDLTVHLWAGMESTNDTPTVAVSFWDGVGDSNAGSATAALSDTAGEVSVTIANANVAAAPGFFNIGLTPAAHGTDALYLYAAWVEYTRKVN